MSALTDAAKNALPFTTNASHLAQSGGFKSKTKLPAGAHGRTVARAVDRIVRNGAHTICVPTNGQAGNKSCRCEAAQASATLLPQEREFLVTVVKEYRDWATEQAAAGAQQAAAQ
jgi:hypothetical protein